MNALDLFSRETIEIVECDRDGRNERVRRITGWRYREFHIHLDFGVWRIGHAPTGCGFPFYFECVEDAARFVQDLAALRNEWERLTRADWDRIKFKIESIAESHGCRYEFFVKANEAALRPRFNGYAEREA